MKRTHYYLVLCIVAILMLAGTGSSTAQDSDQISIIFMHHSTGQNLLWQGNVREGLTERGYLFWDHGYNDDGLTDPDGINTGINWDVPDDNTDPDGWYEIFQQPVTDPPNNTFSHMLQHDVIIFKSCFPSSNIYDEEMFEAYQQYYLTIRDTVDLHPDKLFIAWTTPPLVPNETDGEAAARARRWSEYLTSDEYLEGHPNLVVFNIFDLWAGEDNFLRADYRADEWDSHPNEFANQTVGPIFVEFIDQAIRDFEPGEAAEEPGDPVAAGLFEDFEDEEIDDWLWSSDSSDDFFSCSTATPGFESDMALSLVFEMSGGLYDGCGMDWNMPVNWSETSGLSMVWRSTTPGVPLLVVVWVDYPIQGSQEGETPFAAYVEAPDDEWQEVVIPWEDFALAEWVDNDDIDELDLTRITGISFAIGDMDNAYVGEIWIDDMSLVE